MDLLQEYKELYYKEIEINNSMNNNINTTITLFIVIFSGHMIILNEMTKLEIVIKAFPVLFFLLEVLSIYFTVEGMIYFHKSYYKYNYNYVSPKNIEEKINKNNSCANKFSPYEIEKSNTEMLRATFIEYTKLNRVQNLRKNKNHVKLSGSIIKSILSIMGTYLIWLIFIK